MNKIALSLAAAAVSGALLFSPAHSGSSQEQTLAQMDHRTWTARDGAPQGILELAQSADGTLWIGAESGLYNFDGRTFSAFESVPGGPQLPAEPVYSLLVTKDYNLWVGFLHSGAAHIARGRVTLYPTVEKEPLGLVENLMQAGDGSIWGVSNKRHLVRFGSDFAWHMEQVPKPGARLTEFFIDSSNTLWVPQGGRLYRRPLAQPAYTATDVQADFVFGFAEAPDGSIWMNDIIMAAVIRGRTQHVDHEGHLLTTLHDAEEATDLLYAPDGSLILASDDSGLHRFRAADLMTPRASQGKLSPDVFTSIDGLSSNDERALLLDADRNIWAGGRRGLDRFREAQLVRFVPQNPDGEWIVCAGRQGALWIASNTEQLYKLSGNTTVAFPNAGSIYSLFCSDDGDVWVTDNAGIWHLHSDRLDPVPYVPGVPPYGVVEVVSTSDDTLYARIGNSGGGGYWQYKSNKWTKIVREGGQARGAWGMYLDSHDRLWVGHRDGRVTLPLEGRELSTGDPGLGAVRALLETSHGILAAGTNGVAVLRENRFKMLRFEDEGSARGVGGIVESRNGDIWLNALHGIVRISASEVDTALSRSGYRMKSDLLAEGIFVGASQTLGSIATAARDAEGMLWFCTLNGVVRVDPEHWRAESRPPILSIKSMVVDGRPLDDAAIIGPRPQALEIRYFGVNLTAPEEVIYRYRLDGFDDAWQDVSHRTVAIYTRLPAGTYTFRVSASNGNGVWTSPASSTALTVLPSFYQTKWFAALCICVALAMVWLAFRIRVRAITRDVRARAEERADERIRIARELHDTLLQGIQGLLLTFHVAAQKISPDADSREMLEKALSTADRHHRGT